jgi:hypothetical protein
MKAECMKITLKRTGLGLEMKTIEGKKTTYLFLRKGKEYHVFAEVEAKGAARDCGATKVRSKDEKKNTREMCKEVWERNCRGEGVDRTRRPAHETGGRNIHHK